MSAKMVMTCWLPTPFYLRWFGYAARRRKVFIPHEGCRYPMSPGAMTRGDFRWEYRT